MEEPAETMTSRDLRQGEAGNRVRRRLVQSTLFPQGTREKDSNDDDCKGEEDEVIKDEKEDDGCNSSKKRRRKSLEGKTKNNSRVASQSRAAKKVKFFNILFHSWILLVAL